MSTPIVLHGDAEALIRDIVANHTPELELFDATVSTDLRGYNSGDRWVMITAEGGSYALFNVINKPRIDFEVRAERRDVAHNMAQICHATIFRAVPHRSHGAVLSDAKTELGLVNVPDKEEETSYRYLFALRIVCTADPDSAPGA